MSFSTERHEDSYIQAAYEAELKQIKLNNELGISYLPKSQQALGFLSSNNNVPDFFKNYPKGSFHEIKWNDAIYHLFVSRLDNDDLYLAFKIDAIEEYESSVHQLILLLTILSLFLAFIGGLFVTKIIYSPLGKLANAIKSLTPNSKQLTSYTNNSDLVVIEKALDEYLKTTTTFIENEKHFSGMTSHELRTPLSSMLATIETLLQDKNITEKNRERVLRLQRSGLDMQFVSESLLQIVKFSPVTVVETAPWKLSNLSKNLVDEYQRLIVKNNVMLKLEIIEDIELTVDEKIVKLIIGNLLRNSVKHTDSGEIKISINKNLLLVIDSGRGLNAEQIKQFNLRPIPSLNSESGLGISLVLKLCDLLNWEIQFSENSPKGLKVRVKTND